MEIATGDRVAFLGENGAGKTTLLKIIGGLLYPSMGIVEINGIDTVKYNLKARKSVGFVLNEERSFYWRLSGRENLRFFGTLDNLFHEKLTEKTQEVIELVGLDNINADKPFATYSSGMKQRLAIARGIMCDPDILILDEPTRTLDPLAAVEIKNIILQKIHETYRKTLLIATHRLDEAEDLCNKVCIMKKGRILFFDTMENIMDGFSNLSSCYKEIINQNNKIYAYEV